MTRNGTKSKSRMKWANVYDGAASPRHGGAIWRLSAARLFIAFRCKSNAAFGFVFAANLTEPKILKPPRASPLPATGIGLINRCPGLWAVYAHLGVARGAREKRRHPVPVLEGKRNSQDYVETSCWPEAYGCF